MQFDDMQRMWKLQEGGPGEAYPREAEETVRRMERALRSQRAVLGCSTALTLVSAGVVAFALVKGTRVDLAEVWPLALLQTGAILTVALLWRMRRRRQAAYERCGASVRQAVEWGLANIQRQIREMKILGAWAGVFLPLIALQLMSLYRSGKMDERAIVSFSGICFVILAVNALFFTMRFRTKLRPERQRLSAMLTDLITH